ncbi:helix-turn-helix transcriptional regulator [Xenorhabdus szentirmaii]|nr:MULTISPECIES: AraC family transcriptional regulator [Xenorhabdus]MBD2780745.1 helix-turn-helix transcriptional regulator [Xenorhabdus sp. 38]MBD2791887.1 helix-turn-helix transcriptional regulator [Xenorhabdus sp. CUL]MBD2800614.1 helix-turn-helix transcriptional regulator [Xenorhabdus sp. M]MBD2823460.1 helix-turn-helix transcriptional regulator [Xenorhabdus sp. 5]
MTSSTLTTSQFIRQYKHTTCKLNFLSYVTTEFHQHPCIQLSLSLHGDDLLSIMTEDGTHLTYGCIIGPNIMHKLNSSNTCSITLLIEPTDENYHLFNHLTESLPVIFLERDNIISIINYLIESFLCRKNPDTAIIYSLIGSYLSCHCQFDKRIIKAISFIDSLSVKRVSSRQVADKIYLSESRFLHLFRDQVGINFRAYLLWLRLSDAIEEIHLNDSLTLVANNCGFSDTAHFSRTCKMSYGIRPSDIKRLTQNDSHIDCKTVECLNKLMLNNIPAVT